MTPWRQFWAILRKDLLIDLRRRENWVGMFFFAVLTLVTFQFAGGSLTEPRLRLTGLALESLHEAGWSDAKTSSLRPLLGRSFADQAAFLAALPPELASGLSAAERADLVRTVRGHALQDLAPGLLWVAILLAGVLGLEKSFGQERENACMEGLLLSPAGRGTLYLAKMAGNLVFLALILALLLPLSSLLFEMSPASRWVSIVAVALAGLVGFTALGTLLAGLVASLRGKEVLLPVLLFPLMAPLLIAVVQVTSGLLTGEPLTELSRWLGLLVGFDAVYLILSALVFEFVVES